MGIDVKQTFDQPYVLVLLTSFPQGMRSGSLVGAFVGICVGITLFYTVVLLVLISALILWNKRHTGILQVCMHRLLPRPAPSPVFDCLQF